MGPGRAHNAATQPKGTTAWWDGYGLYVAEFAVSLSIQMPQKKCQRAKLQFLDYRRVLVRGGAVLVLFVLLRVPMDRPKRVQL